METKIKLSEKIVLQIGRKAAVGNTFIQMHEMSIWCFIYTKSDLYDRRVIEIDFCKVTIDNGIYVITALSIDLNDFL